MRRMSMWGSWAALGLAIVVATGAAEAPSPSARSAFDRLKGLAGEWTGTTPAGKPVTVAYRVTANGSAVQETLFPGTPHEMVTMYHLDGDDLLLTHYCAAGNQPRMKLDRAASSPDELVFAFDGGTNLDPAVDMHMHSGRIRFGDGGRVVATWDGFAAGKKCHSETFSLRRP